MTAWHGATRHVHEQQIQPFLLSKRMSPSLIHQHWLWAIFAFPVMRMLEKTWRHCLSFLPRHCRSIHHLLTGELFNLKCKLLWMITTRSLLSSLQASKSFQPRTLNYLLVFKHFQFLEEYKLCKIWCKFLHESLLKLSCCVRNCWIRVCGDPATEGAEVWAPAKAGFAESTSVFICPTVEPLWCADLCCQLPTQLLLTIISKII